ncbi:hypothetical protein ACTXT7_004684 [Hymenolepis weldensis]
MYSKKKKKKKKKKVTRDFVTAQGLAPPSAKLGHPYFLRSKKNLDEIRDNFPELSNLSVIPSGQFSRGCSH